MQDVVKAPRARIEEERTRRRRRDDMGVGRHRHLAINGDLDPAYEYRWINDEPGRVHLLTVRDDWDRVTSADLGERDEKDRNVGAGVERIVDRATGKRAILVRKPKDFYRADKAKEQAALDEVDAAIKRGQVPDKGGEEALRGSHAYIPSGGIRITDGRRS
jgi:hypothetical protein